MNLVYTGRFKKDFKLMMKRNKDTDKLFAVADMLLKGKPLLPKNRDHALIGNWKSRRECHIEPNWLLIYCIRGSDLILERTGSHADLFR